MNKSKRELKEIVQGAMLYDFGFAPALRDICLLEASGDGTHILFRLHNIEYTFDSFIWHPFKNDKGEMLYPVWVGNDTCRRTARLVWKAHIEGQECGGYVREEVTA
jgi:hypothetical protein